VNAYIKNKVTSLAMTLFTSKLLTALNQHQERGRSRIFFNGRNILGEDFNSKFGV
jgi:hypothetical protein